MRTLIILASLGATLVLPAAASAATRCQQNNTGNEVAGTVLGGILGGLVGNAVSHGHSRSTGTAIGAVGGAVIGNRLAAGSNQPCPEGYYAYEDNSPAVDAYGRPTASYDQYSQTTPAYSYDAYGNRAYSNENAQPSYTQEQRYSSQPYDRYTQTSPSYSSGYSRYSERADNDRAPATNSYSYDRSSTNSDRTYASQSYQSQSATTWQDAYGRTCRWRDSVDAYGEQKWVKSCQR